MDILKCKIEGTNSLLVHSERGANPLDKRVKDLKALTAKKKKSDDDLVQIARIEWELALYYSKDPKVGPFIPGANVHSMINAAARLEKRGKDINRAVRVIENEIPLVYKGPRSLDELFARPEHVDMRSVRVGMKRIMRCRPIFDQWSLQFTLEYDREVINVDDIKRILDAAGRMVGLGDYRPRYGQFEVKEIAA